jgi:hypothetical protein
MTLTARGDEGDPTLPNPPPEGFEVKLTKVTPGQKKVSANGTYKCPDSHEVISGVLVLVPVAGGNAVTVPVTHDAQNKTWSVNNEAVPAGTYDVYTKLTFRKKNPQVGDLAFEVASNVEVNVTISP